MSRVPARVAVPSYMLGVVLLAVAAMMWATYAVSVKKANENAQDLIRRYERDKTATAETNRRFYCALFSSQLDAYAGAESPVGEAAYRAWDDLYRLAHCLPDR